MNSQASIQIKKIFENKTGPHKILDTGGQYWKVWPDVYEELNFKENSRYDIQYKKGEYQGKPDNVIKSAFLLESNAVIPSGTGPAVAANGHAAPALDKDCLIWIECILGRVWKDKIPLGDGDSLLHAAEVAKDVYYQLTGKTRE